MTDLLTIGETMVSLRTPRAMRLGGEAHLSIAGSETNVAIGLARLGHTATWLGAVGNDEPGRLIERTLRAEAIGTAWIRFSDTDFTGFIAFDQPSHDITRVSYHRRGSAGSTLTVDECLAGLEAVQPRLLHVTGITPALSDTARAAVLATVRVAAANGVQVSLDVNYRARLWSREDATALRELLPHIHTVFASDDELDLLTNATDPVADLLTTATEVVVTAGSKGAWSHTTTGTRHSPALPVTVVDSIGAGDAFVSGYLSGTLDDLSSQDRLTRATTSGAFCVTALGDWESLPTRQDLTLLTHTQGTALR
ncbi:sugar kinase [Kribbella antibiotica]|uniref:Sugar kinase n=1 Tax=Kribbella antibiotica TaxID=190195 RepID=A0A4R4YL04_9ACTN|nr:sugar kinase [Kribbella antibiotica]TDD45651.1 sugar kinase [Kribbella antibiotica]